ncbi:TPA: hypothetical protein OR428_004026 [Escherichia coli]|nr:hypothetical protein [Escherichia coli]
MKYYMLKPFRIGILENDITVKESEQYVIIDIISGEEILYCDDNCYLITPTLLKSLKDSNLTGVNVVKPKNMKFSIEHNMKHPNKSLREWYRLIPFKYDSSKNQEMFLDQYDNLIINERIKNIIYNKDIHRVKRAFITEYEMDKVVHHDEEIIEQPVFKKENKTTFKDWCVFMFILITIIYLFFK